MKTIWTSRTYADELRELSRGTRWPSYGYTGRADPRRPKRTWRLKGIECVCLLEHPQAAYDNCIAASPCLAALMALRLSDLIVGDFGWEAVAG
jgi:hypothetical protein